MSDKLNDILSNKPLSLLVQALVAISREAEVTTQGRFVVDGTSYEAMTVFYPDSIESVAELAEFLNARLPEPTKLYISDFDHERRLARIVLPLAVIRAYNSEAPESRQARRLQFQPKAAQPAPFVNESDNDFTDISSEATRSYNFGQKGFVKINNPLKLSVSSSGGHRIFSADGQSHYIPAGWIHLSWTVKQGQPNFVK